MRQYCERFPLSGPPAKGGPGGVKLPSNNPVSPRLPTRQRVWRLVFCLALTVACSPSHPPVADDFHLRIGFGLNESRERRSAMAVLASYLSSESMLSIEATGRPQPGLAERWHWSEDGRTLVVELRPGVRFHDGSPVTAASVVSALERPRERQRPSSAFRHVTSIAAEGDTAVAIQLARPDAFLLGELAQIRVTGANGTGTGPFRIVSAEEPLRLERFDGYYRGPSAIRSIVIHPFDSQRSAWAALLRGEVDAVQEIQPDSVEFMRGSTQVTTSSLVRPFYIMLALNQRHDVLRHTDVRRAIAEAVDREEIVRDALRGMARVADNPIWPDHWALSSAARRYTHNPEAARLRLDGAGVPLKRAGQKGMVRRFSVTCVFWEEEPRYERIALLLQRQLMRVGIDLQLKGVPLNDWTTRIGTGEFEILLLPARGGRSLDVTYDFWRSPAGGASPHLNLGYTGLDGIFDRLRTARTDAEVRTAVGDLQERFYEDAPAVFLAWQQTTRAVSSHIDVGKYRDSDIFSNIWQWRRADARQSP